MDQYGYVPTLIKGMVFVPIWSANIFLEKSEKGFGFYKGSVDHKHFSSFPSRSLSWIVTSQISE